MDSTQFVEELKNIHSKLSKDSKSDNNTTISKINKLETLVFYDILLLSPISETHKNKSHRSKEEGEKQFIINICGLSNCIICLDGSKPSEIDKSNGGSYYNKLNNKLYYYKKAKMNPIIFDLSAIKDNMWYQMEYMLMRLSFLRK